MKPKRLFYLLTLSFLLVVTMGTDVLAKRWSRNKLWKDGRAEVAVYDSKKEIEGTLRTFRERFVTIPEEMEIESFVKADDPKKAKTKRVIKLNVVGEVKVGNVSTQSLISVFVDAKDPFRLVKMTAAINDWSGSVFHIFKRGGEASGGDLQWFSYKDGEADGMTSLLLEENDVLENQLPLTLRTIPLEEGFEKKIRVWSDLGKSAETPATVVEAVIRVPGEEVIRCYAGALPSWKVEVEYSQGKDTYWFHKEYPHILTKMESRNGLQRLLHGRARWTYWDSRIPEPFVLK